MKWREKDEASGEYLYDYSEVGLDVTYYETIENLQGEKKVPVCISGDETGSWKGILEYRTESNGNQGIGVGVILKVNIEDKPDEVSQEETQNPPASSSSSSSGAGGGGSSGGGVVSSNTPSNLGSPDSLENSGNSNNDKTLLGTLEGSSEEKDSESTVTGNAIVFDRIKENYKAFLVVLAIITVFAGIKFYKKN